VVIAAELLGGGLGTPVEIARQAIDAVAAGNKSQYLYFPVTKITSVRSYEDGQLAGQRGMSDTGRTMSVRNRRTEPREMG
jgi:hypothetical protein